MQSEMKHVYKTLSEETGKNEELYKDIGSFVFKEMSKMLKEPSSLILKLKGVGTWHLRKSRLEIFVGEFTEPTHDEYTCQQTLDEWVEKRKRYNNFVQRLKEYDKYLEVKKEIREKRHEGQILLEPDKREDEGSEPS